MLQHSFNGTSSRWNFLAAKGGHYLGLLENLWEMLHFTCAGGGDHRDGDIVPHVVDQLDVKAGVGAVLINAVRENLPGTELLTDLGQLQGVHVSAFPTTRHDALIPAISEKQN